MVTMKRPVWAAAALLGVLVASATLFAEGKRYPPYPDVWGYELAYPAPGSRHASPRAYTMPDGEIRFIFATTLRYEKGVPRAVEYAALDYFKGTLVPITRAEWDRFGREFSAHRVEFAEPTRMRVQFGDGSSVRLVEGMPWNLCGGVLFDTWLVALDPKGAERRSVHILYLRPDEVVKRVDALGLPSYSGFVMPKLTPVMGADGTITDVTISYPMDLTAQMLEYSGVRR